jgi:hypothetical protein
MNSAPTTRGAAPFLEGSPFGQSHDIKQPGLLAELSELTRLHSEGSASYARMIASVFGRNPRYDCLEDLPWLPVQLFKRLELKSVPDEQIVRTLVSSGTTGAAPSRVFLDKETARAQTTALARIVGHFIGPQRLPMVIVDNRSSAEGIPRSPTEATRDNRSEAEGIPRSPNGATRDDNSVVANRIQFNARGAATLGFSNMGRDHFYALDARLEPKWGELEDYLRKHAGHPLMLFGFTFLVWQFAQQAQAAGVALRFPAGSILIHGGGWKKLQDRQVSNDTFKAGLRDTFGLERVHNYYGMVEQVGSIFFECEAGWLHTPAYADVIVRDRMTLEPLACGQEGLIQVLSLLPRSYPGHSLLTEDLGTIAGEDDCSCGRKGKRFAVAGRLPQAELRGCSDTRAMPAS